MSHASHERYRTMCTNGNSPQEYIHSSVMGCHKQVHSCSDIVCCTAGVCWLTVSGWWWFSPDAGCGGDQIASCCTSRLCVQSLYHWWTRCASVAAGWMNGTWAPLGDGIDAADAASTLSLDMRQSLQVVITLIQRTQHLPNRCQHEKMNGSCAPGHGA